VRGLDRGSAQDHEHDVAAAVREDQVAGAQTREAHRIPNAIWAAHRAYIGGVR